MTGRRAGSREGRAAVDRLSETHEQLTAAVEALASEGQWARMLATAAKFPRYSPSNVLLIMMQRPDATKVAGLRAWNSLGRKVVKGEKSIAILAPCTYPVRRDTDETQPAHGKLTPADDPHAPIRPDGDGPKAKEVKGFRVVRVFDVSQTEGEPLPEQPAPLRLAGAAPAGVWDALAGVAVSDGYTLQRDDCGAADGWTNYRDRTIRIPADVDDAHATLTLAHEIGHIRAEHETRFAGLRATSRDCRGIAEVEAESIAYLVATTAGLAADGASVPYVATWANGDLDLVRATAARVIATSRAVLDAAGLLPAGLESAAPAVGRAAGRGSAGRWTPTTARQPARHAAAARPQVIGR